MMKRIAKETTVHGIKEAVYANRIGRVFFIVVFITCGVLMFFQLNGLFQAYINERVGTRLSFPAALDDVEEPSFYYCNDMWYPNIRGLLELNRSGSGPPKKLEEQTLALHIGVLRQNDTTHPLDNFWRKMRIEDLINGIMLPPEKGRFDKMQIGLLRPKKGSDDFYHRAYREMTEMLKDIIGSSLHEIVKKNLEEPLVQENAAQLSLMSKTHGIFPNASPVKSHLFKAYAKEFVSSLSDRAGIPTLTLDGICWEFPARLVRQKTKQSVVKIHRHVATHFGGLGRQLSKLVHLYLTTYGSTEIRDGETFISGLDRVIGEVMKYSALYTSIYKTYVSIAMKSHPYLLFDQKIHINSWTRHVRLKYWTKRTVRKSRNDWPCRSESWTDLDQAHCNLNHARDRGDLLCDQYLPASNHFQETGITNETCIYDHTGLFELAKSAAAKQSIGPRAGYPLHISSASRHEVLFNLTANTLRCPKPCSKTMFQFEATYPTSEFALARHQCFAALAYIFVPLEDINEASIGNYTAQFHDGSSLKPLIFERAHGVIQNLPFRHLFARTFKSRDQWPCSVVEFERSEMHGQLIEEYFLYSFSDLAANVGGTMGLWIGASVISFAQLIYLCCLKRFFKRIHRYKFSYLTGCARRLRPAVAKQRMGDRRAKRPTRQMANLRNRIANDSTIHGIKEAWYANRIGRTFFAIVFATCFLFMFFQLKGVLQDYVNDNIGTRLTDVTAVDVVEEPSFNYCNDMWFPNIHGLNELKRSGHGMPKRLLDQIVALNSVPLRQNNTVYPVDNLWRQMRMQDLINGIALLPEEGRFDKMQMAAISPDRESDDFYLRSIREMTKMLKGLVGGSLGEAVKAKLGDSSTQPNSEYAALIDQTHGIFPHMIQPGVSLSDEKSVKEFFSTLSHRSGNLTLSLDGVCWQFASGPVRQKAQQSIGERHRHVVAHFGGLGRQFSQLMYLYLTTRGSSEVYKGDTTISALSRAVNEVIRYSSLYKNIYATHVFIATQGVPHLLFGQKLRIDSFSPHVLLKYWTKKSVLKSRKDSPCRSGTWTDLDQAHCNQKFAKERGNLQCEQYLPASNHYQETDITDSTCFYDYTGLVELGISAAAKRPSTSSFEFPLQLSSVTREEVMFNLTANSIRCPKPCTETLFQFETTYPTSEFAEARAQCWFALAYFFVPLKDLKEVWLGVNQVDIFGSIKPILFHIAASIVMLKNPYNPMYSRYNKHMQQWPCSVVEFERSETHGQLVEEYFLYSFSDLSANVGGTMGLCIGASVISFVQLIYLCCLKKLFKRVHRYKFSYLNLTGCARRLRPAVVKQRVGDRKTRRKA